MLVGGVSPQASAVGVSRTAGRIVVAVPAPHSMILIG